MCANRAFNGSLPRGHRLAFHGGKRIILEFKARVAKAWIPQFGPATAAFEFVPGIPGRSKKNTGSKPFEFVVRAIVPEAEPIVSLLTLS